MSMMKAKLISL